jgi:hypothetical protein
MQKHFEKWAASSKELGARGHIKDPGHPLEGAGRLVKANRRSSTMVRTPAPRISLVRYMLIEA